jgi:hypothetical protein
MDIPYGNEAGERGNMKISRPLGLVFSLGVYFYGSEK